MKLTKCSNNHFYDGDKYSQCPHCGASKESGKETIKEVVSEKKSTSRKSLFRKHTISKHSMLNEEDVIPEDKTEAIVPNEDIIIDDCIEKEEEVVSPDELESNEIQGEFQEEALEEEHSEEKLSIGSLQEAVNEVKLPNNLEDTKTMAFYDVGVSEPVVGWLVCVKGEYVGESFNLKTGRNTIGRSLKMDVLLSKEVSVSRDRHAIITYEPKHRKFYIQPGEGSGLTYRNDELIMLPTEIKNYDKIQIGNCEMIFCAFCGENFSWEEYI